ncbi:hypothetical protein HGA92_00285 [Candidatus Gracilibacteria bacterium]|nr:hypothetical protein [Candidatus Gracilibacteria bacterium]NUJ98951.1 hypothetical protein [Candidatus Gracilibacteria bacterium]
MFEKFLGSNNKNNKNNKKLAEMSSFERGLEDIKNDFLGYVKLILLGGSLFGGPKDVSATEKGKVVSDYNNISGGIGYSDDLKRYVQGRYTHIDNSGRFGIQATPIIGENGASVNLSIAQLLDENLVNIYGGVATKDINNPYSQDIGPKNIDAISFNWGTEINHQFENGLIAGAFYEGGISPNGKIYDKHTENTWYSDEGGQWTEYKDESLQYKGKEWHKMGVDTKIPFKKGQIGVSPYYFKEGKKSGAGFDLTGILEIADNTKVFGSFDISQGREANWSAGINYKNIEVVGGKNEFLGTYIKGGYNVLLGDNSYIEQNKRIKEINRKSSSHDISYGTQELLPGTGVETSQEMKQITELMKKFLADKNNLPGDVYKQNRQELSDFQKGKKDINLVWNNFIQTLKEGKESQKLISSLINIENPEEKKEILMLARWYYMQTSVIDISDGKAILKSNINEYNQTTGRQKLFKETIEREFSGDYSLINALNEAMDRFYTKIAEKKEFDTVKIQEVMDEAFIITPNGLIPYSNGNLIKDSIEPLKGLKSPILIDKLPEDFLEKIGKKINSLLPNSDKLKTKEDIKKFINSEGNELLKISYTIYAVNGDVCLNPGLGIEFDFERIKQERMIFLNDFKEGDFRFGNIKYEKTIDLGYTPPVTPPCEEEPIFTPPCEKEKKWYEKSKEEWTEKDWEEREESKKKKWYEKPEVEWTEKDREEREESKKDGVVSVPSCDYGKVIPCKVKDNCKPNK